MKADAIGLLMWIDTVIYGFVDYVYDIFNALAKVKLFEESSYQSIVRNIYAVLGIIMLFVLAYSLLKAVINPDEFAKGETSFPKLIKNVVISLAIIAVLPTVFTVVFNFQNAILNKDTIPKLIFGTGTDYNNENAGSEMAYYVFSAFLHPDFMWCEEKKYQVNDPKTGDVNLSECADNINADGDVGVTNGPTLKAVSDGVLAGGEKSESGNYSIFDFKYGESVADGKVTYNIFISTIAGVFLLYVLVNFCFDMAVRVVKLMFFQIIAPIPVICRVIPGGKLKDVFSDWMKKTISTYVDVFIRIATMYLGVYMIKLVTKNFSGINFGGLGLSQKLIAKALIIMGIVIFIRQAPKLISDMFHLDSGGMKLGLMDKLAMGGALTAGSVAGGAFGMLGRNTVSAVKGFNDAKGKGFRERAKALGFGAASIGAGTFSGAVRGFNRGKGAKNFADMKKASGGAVTAATAAKAKRDAYRANYKNTHPGEGAIQGLFGIGGSHILDKAEGVGEYFGINSLDELNHEKEVADTMQGFYKTMAGYVSDNEMVMSYQGMYDAEMKREISDTVTEFDSTSYNSDLIAKVRALESDSRYSKMSQSDLYRIAGSELNKSNYTHTRRISEAERANAIQQKQDNLKMYEQLKKMATIQAVNEKLNKVGSDGKIVDGRFQKIANQVEVFKQQNATYDFVKNMSDISGVTWDQTWTDIMRSGNAAAVDKLMDKFKDGSAGITFFSDSEAAKNHSGDVDAAIGKKIQEKKKDNK